MNEVLFLLINAPMIFYGTFIAVIVVFVTIYESLK
jgi:hypothetical protein